VQTSVCAGRRRPLLAK